MWPDWAKALRAKRQERLSQRNVCSLAGNDLPARWQGRDQFVILETGFGRPPFLRTWRAWRDDPQPLLAPVFVSIEQHPLTRLTWLRSTKQKAKQAQVMRRCLGPALWYKLGRY